jgi:hypothetical protein
MPIRMASFASSAAACLAVMAASAAFADPAAGEAAFKRGRDLLKAGKTDEACRAFAESLEHDFQYGTLYNLAGCEEKRGKLASALAAYSRLAAEDTNPGRRARSAELTAALAARVGKLVIVLAEAAPGVSIEVDGKPVSIGAETPVDAGDHAVILRGDGFRTATATATTKDGSVLRLELRAEPLSQPKPTPTPMPTPPATVATVRTTGYPTAGKIMMGAGGGVVLAGMSVAIYEKTVYDRYVRDGEVIGGPDSVQRANRAVDIADVMTYVCVGGLAVATTGFVLWWKSGKVTTIQPVVAPDSVGVVGTF